MAELADGERRAFEPLFAALYPRALAVGKRRVPELAEDVAQSTLTRLFAHASDFEPGRPVLPWFYAICANEVRSALRRRGQRGDVEATEIVSEAATPEEELAEAELLRLLDAEMEKLDPDSAEAIGALLGRNPLPDVPSPTFRKRVSRAYQKLRRMIVP